ncbi:hypothetical protein ACFX2I_022655 [Malus domestica]
MENITGLDQNVINNGERNDQYVNKKTEQTDELENISINEAQIEFNKLFGEKMIKLDAIVQKHIIGMNTIISEELFDEFKKARSIVEKRYITFREMMAHAMDASNRECLILGQTNIMLSSEVEKLLQKVETKTSANILKINDYLKQIGSLKKKLEKSSIKDTLKDKKELTPVPHATEIQVQMKTPTVELMPNGAEMEV